MTTYAMQTVRLYAVTCRFRTGTTRMHLMLIADDGACFDGTVVISAPSDTVLDLPYDYRFVQQSNNQVLIHPPLDNDVGYTLDELLASGFGTLRIDHEQTYPCVHDVLQPCVWPTDDDETPGYLYPRVDELLQPLTLR